MTAKFRENFYNLVFPQLPTILITPAIAASGLDCGWIGVFILTTLHILFVLFTNLACAFGYTHLYGSLPWQNNSSIYQQYRQKLEEERATLLRRVSNYAQSIFSPYLTDSSIDLLIQNIQLFDSSGSIHSPILDLQILSSLDLSHFAWNIGERLGWSGRKRAQFVKLCFPNETAGIELDTIRRNLKARRKSRVLLDIPEEGLNTFHLPYHLQQ